MGGGSESGYKAKNRWKNIPPNKLGHPVISSKKTVHLVLLNEVC